MAPPGIRMKPKVQRKSCSQVLRMFWDKSSCSEGKARQNFPTKIHGRRMLMISWDLSSFFSIGPARDFPVPAAIMRVVENQSFSWNIMGKPCRVVRMTLHGMLSFRHHTISSSENLFHLTSSRVSQGVVTENLWKFV